MAAKKPDPGAQTKAAARRLRAWLDLPPATFKNQAAIPPANPGPTEWGSTLGIDFSVPEKPLIDPKTAASLAARLKSAVAPPPPATRSARPASVRRPSKTSANAASANAARANAARVQAQANAARAQTQADAAQPDAAQADAEQVTPGAK
jgi:hypothetical protein